MSDNVSIKSKKETVYGRTWPPSTDANKTDQRRRGVAIATTY